MRVTVRRMCISGADGLPGLRTYGEAVLGRKLPCKRLLRREGAGTLRRLRRVSVRIAEAVCL